MQFEIRVDDLDSEFYDDYAEFVFSEVEEDISDLVERNIKKYRAREFVVINSPLMKWKRSPPSRINLARYVRNCLSLIKVRGVYVVRLDESQTVRGSLTKVSTLVRALEYGTETIPEFSLIRRVVSYYRDNCNDMFDEYIEERLFSE